MISKNHLERSFRRGEKDLIISNQIIYPSCNNEYGKLEKSDRMSTKVFKNRRNY